RDNAVAKKLVESGPGHPNGVGFTAIGEDGTYRLVTVPGLILLQAGVDANVTAEGVRTEHKFRPPVPDPKYPDYFVKRDPYWHYYMVTGTTGLQGNFCKVVDVPADAVE